MTGELALGLEWDIVTDFSVTCFGGHVTNTRPRTIVRVKSAGLLHMRSDIKFVIFGSEKVFEDLYYIICNIPWWNYFIYSIEKWNQ